MSYADTERNRGRGIVSPANNLYNKDNQNNPNNQTSLNNKKQNSVNKNSVIEEKDGIRAIGGAWRFSHNKRPQVFSFKDLRSF